MCINNRYGNADDNNEVEPIYFVKHAVIAIIVLLISCTCYAGSGNVNGSMNHNCIAFIQQGGVTFNDLHGHVDEGQVEDWHHYSVLVPEGVSDVYILNEGGNGDADLYTKENGVPDLKIYDCRPFGHGNVEACEANNLVSNSDYYFSLNTASTNYDGSNLLVNYNLPDSANANRTEGFGWPLNSLPQGTMKHFMIDVPDGLKDLNITISGGTGDADLYLIYGIDESISTANFYKKGTENGNEESIFLQSPVSGQYTIGLHASSNISNIHLKVSYDAFNPGAASAIDDVPEPLVQPETQGLNYNEWSQKYDDDGNVRYFHVDVPDDKLWLLTYAQSNGGDVDIYVSKEKIPTTKDYHCRSINSGFKVNGVDDSFGYDNINTEWCLLPVNGGGRYYVMMTSYKDRFYDSADVLAFYSTSLSKIEQGLSSTATNVWPESLILKDDFNQGYNSDVDVSKWARGLNAPNNAHIAYSQLKLNISEGYNQSAWIRTTNNYVAKNTAVTVHIPQANREVELSMSPSYTQDAENGFYHERDIYRFHTSGTLNGPYSLYVSSKKNWVWNTVKVTGDMFITNEIYLRLLMDETNIYFQASLDGVTWDTKYYEPFSLTNYTLDDKFYYSLSSFKPWNNNGGNGDALLDNFEIRSKISTNNNSPSALKISNVAVTNITSNSASISWNTDKPSTSQVFYGVTGNYDRQSNKNTVLKTAHSMELNDLASDTTYHFNVRSEGESGKTSYSDDIVLRTVFVGLMEDNFNQGVSGEVQNTKWHNGANNQNKTHIYYDQLKLYVSNNYDQSAWLITKNSYQARNTSVSAHITKVSGNGGLAMSPTYIPNSINGVVSEPDNYRFYTEGPVGGPYALKMSHRKGNCLHAEIDVTGSMLITSDVFLRLRFDDTHIYFDASADGISWVTKHSQVFDLPGYSLDHQFYYSLWADKPWLNGLGFGKMFVDDFKISENSNSVTSVLVSSILTPSADTNVRYNDETSKGSEKYLAIKGQNNYVRNTYIKYDLSSMNAAPSSASLNLTFKKSWSNNISTVAAYEFSDTSWDENIVWSNRPNDSAMGVELSTRPIPVYDGELWHINVTDYIVDRYNNGATEVAFTIRSFYNGASIYARESAFGPQLILETIE